MEKTEERREKRESKKEIGEGKKEKERKKDGSRKSSRRIGDLGQGGRNSKIREGGKKTSTVMIYVRTNIFLFLLFIFLDYIFLFF